MGGDNDEVLISLLWGNFYSRPHVGGDAKPLPLWHCQH